MADSKITALGSIGTGTDPANDQLVIVDVSDVLPTGMATTGTTKRVSLNNLLASSPTATLASATITGALTVDTNTLKVDATNHRVIVGHTSGSSAFQVSDAGGAGLEVQPTGVNSAPVIFAYNRSGSAYTQLTLGGSTIVHTLSGTTAMTLNSTGLGIGVSPVYKFHAVVTSGAVGAFRATTAAIARLLVGNTVEDVELKVNANGDGQLTANASKYLSLGSGGINDRVILDTSGNLLVGATSALQLSNNVSVTSRIANLGTGSKGAMILRENEASAFWGGNLYLQKVRGTSTAVQSGDALGLVAFGGFDGANYVNTATIQTLVTGAVSAGVVPVKIQVVATSGGVELTNTATSWAAISDERLKDIIEPINNAVSKVGLLRSVIGKYKSDSEGTRRSFLIAQDVQSALPEAVGGNEDSMTVRYTEVIPLLVAAIKELTARVQTLETR